MSLETLSQQVLILKALDKRPHNTAELRDMNILSPNPRILELRRMGFEIETEWGQMVDSAGTPHRIGVYHLIDTGDVNKRGEMILEAARKGM